MITDDESTVLADAERAPLMSARSKRYPDQQCWISTRLPAALEHDRHTVARCVRDHLLSVTEGHTLALTELGNDALNDYRYNRHPARLVA